MTTPNKRDNDSNDQGEESGNGSGEGDHRRLKRARTTSASDSRDAAQERRHSNTSSAAAAARPAAAAASRPRSEDSNDDEDDEESGRLGTYPHPSTFAERLMHILENGLATDTIWWLNEGEAIALHSKMVKSDPVLKRYFKGNQYKSFTRNLIRWGFRKIPYFGLPGNVMALRCSLFRRDKPHLVQHMQMDSDVQDVFDSHEMQRPAPSSSTEESKQQALGPQLPVGAMSLPFQQEHLHGPLSPGQMPPISGTTTTTSTATRSTPTPHDLMAFLTSALAQQQQQALPQQQPIGTQTQSRPPNDPTVASYVSDNTSTAIATAASVPPAQGQPRTTPSSAEGSSSSGSGSDKSITSTLHHIIQLAQVYLNQTATNATDAVPMRALMQVVIIVGNQELLALHKQLARRELNNNSNSNDSNGNGNGNGGSHLQDFLMRLGQMTQGFAPPVPTPLPTPTTTTSTTQGQSTPLSQFNLLQHQLMQQQLQIQQQQQQQQQPSDRSQPTLSNTAPSSQFELRQQPLPQPFQQQQSLPPPPPPAADGGMAAFVLLQQILGQQQQATQTSSEPPPGPSPPDSSTTAAVPAPNNPSLTLPQLYLLQQQQHQQEALRVLLEQQRQSQQQQQQQQQRGGLAKEG